MLLVRHHWDSSSVTVKWWWWWWWLDCAVACDVIRNHYTNEVALHHPPASLPPPLPPQLAPPPPPPPPPAGSRLVWKSAGCYDAGVVMATQLPQQHYPAAAHAAYNSYNASSPSDVPTAPWQSHATPLDHKPVTHSTHHKTSVRGRHPERHKDRRVILLSTQHALLVTVWNISCLKCFSMHWID